MSAPIVSCPTCGQPMAMPDAPLEILSDRNERLIWRRGGQYAINLTKREMEFLDILMRRVPLFTRADALARDLYRIRDTTDNHLSSVRMLVHSLRKQLHPLNLDIEAGERRGGYRLVDMARPAIDEPVQQGVASKLVEGSE